jgi:ribulose-phosphate 3-epimerase
MHANSPRWLLVPSILSADFGRLAEQVQQAVAAGADRFQVDIMDGHFVPNISMGPMFVETMRGITSLPLEAHLMVSRPEQWIQACSDAGANVIIVHAEATVHLHRVVESIVEAGARPAVALNPASPLVLLQDILPALDMVLLMTVNPGFGGQQFIAPVLDKIRDLRARIGREGLKCDIEIDGGVDAETIVTAAEAGANVFVAGSSVFGARVSVAEAIAELRAALARPAGV